MLRLRVPMFALLACACLCAAALGAATPALASQRQATFFEAPEELLNPATRPGAIRQLQTLGVSALRLEVTWWLRRAWGKQRDGARIRSRQPGLLRLGRLRRGDRRSQPPEMAGAADGRLAGAALGDRQQASAVRHAPRRP